MDIFTSTKYQYWLCKILGTITFSINGFPKSRLLKVNKKDRFFSTFWIIVIVILIGFSYESIEQENFSFLFVVSYVFLFYFIYFIWLVERKRNS